MITQATDPDTQLPTRRASRRGHRRKRLAAAVVVLAVLIGAGVIVDHTRPYGISLAHPPGVRHHAKPSRGGNAAATTTAAIARRSLSARTSLDGTLGYAGDYTVAGQGRGTITWLPAVGQVIHQGQVLYRVDGQPVMLLYGATPVYRQLNRDLVALGYASSDDLDPSSDEFSWATKAAIKALQEHLGLTQTGKLDLGQILFLPTAARVTSLSATLGGQASGPVLKATSTRRQVTVNLDAAQQSQIKVGDKVTITLPNGRTTPGRVASVGKVASTPTAGSSDSPTVEVDITPTDAAATGTLDKAPVQVEITTATARNALVVPVNALLALAGGGYAVEVVAPDGLHRLVPVSLGLFDDAAGLVQVTGSGLAAGQHVVVPTS